MSVKFTVADDEISQRLAAVMKEQHAELHRAAVTVGVLMCESQNGGPSMSLHGYPCAAKVAVVNVKYRVLGVADAMILIAGEIWKTLDEDSQEALLDHELRHLVVVTDKYGIARDCAGRPKLNTVPHDYHLGGFHENVRLYGRRALEAMSLAQVIASQTGQLLFRDFAVDLTSFGLPAAGMPLPVTEPHAQNETPEADQRSGEAGEVPPASPGAEGDAGGADDGHPPEDLAAAAAPAPRAAAVERRPAGGQSLDDALVGAALEVLRETGRASTSALQRRLKLGYARACALMDELERRGHVGPPRGANAREILKLPAAAA